MSRCIDDCLWIKKNVAILNIKGVDDIYIMWGIHKNEAFSILNSFVLEEKGILQMDFGAIKTPVQVMKEGAFGGKYFGNIYSGINRKCYRISWKKFDQLKDIYQKNYSSSYYNVSVNKCGVKYTTSLRLWENKCSINKIDPYGWF